MIETSRATTRRAIEEEVSRLDDALVGRQLKNSRHQSARGARKRLLRRALNRCGEVEARVVQIFEERAQTSGLNGKVHSEIQDVACKAHTDRR